VEVIWTDTTLGQRYGWVVDERCHQDQTALFNNSTLPFQRGLWVASGLDQLVTHRSSARIFKAYLRYQVKASSRNAGFGLAYFPSSHKYGHLSTNPFGLRGRLDSMGAYTNKRDQSPQPLQFPYVASWKRGQTAEIAERRREKEENSLGDSLRSPGSLRLKWLFAADSSD
jgi:hypothetical protein